MPLLQETVPSGTDFDGTAGQGLIDFSAVFSDVSNLDDSVRAVIMGLGVSAEDDVLRSTIVRLGPAGLLITDLGYLQLANSTDSQGISIFGCSIVVPRTFSLFVFTEEDGQGPGGPKQLVVDYRVTRLMPRTA